MSLKKKLVYYFLLVTFDLLCRNAPTTILHQLLQVADDHSQHGDIKVLRLGHSRRHRTQRRHHGHGILQNATGARLFTTELDETDQTELTDADLQELESALRMFNYFFTAVFIVETGAKICALGFRRHIKDRWNQLDVSIVILSIVGIILEEMESDLIPINPTIIRVMRVLRIARG